MARYTMTLEEIINLGINIFDFNYELFSEEYKSTFEKLFIDYFYVEEIAHETVGLFKHRLKTKLNLILPYYNKLYLSQNLEQRILDNYDVTEKFDRNISGTSTKELKGNNHVSSNGVSKNLYKDAPKTRIDINNFDVVTNLSKDENTMTSTINNVDTENANNSNVESWTRTMQGNIGVQTDADAIIKYEQSLRNITLEIFEKELTGLFMGVF